MLVAQFTYTACQQPGPYDSVPGWKVKQVEPLDASRELVQDAVRSFGTFTSPPVDALATMAEIQALPRRLRLDILRGSYRTLSHLAPAGRDHTDRDAFFAHALVVATGPAGFVLDPQAVGAAGYDVPRPADMWSATGWLAPYGAAAIESAVLGPLPVISGASPLDTDMRKDFAELHPGQRLFVFAAVEQSMADGRPLIIAGSPVETAMWVSILTHLMIPSVGWSFGFSTYERASDLPSLLAAGHSRVIGIPSEEAGLVQHSMIDRVRLLESDAVPARDRWLFRHSGRQDLPIGPWANLAERVCVLGLEEQVRRSIDQLAAEVGTSTDSSPQWGLPAGILLASERTGDWPTELEMTAAELATATFPLGAGLTDTTGRRLIDAILAVLGDPLTVFGSLFRTADKDADVDPALRDHIVRGYLTAVLRDQAAFVGPTQPWLPASLKLSNSVSAALLGRLPELIGWSDRADPVIRARVVLFVAKLAESLGWTVGQQARVVGLVVGARAEDALLPLLLAGTPLLPAGGWPPVPSWLWTRCLEPALNDVLTEVRTENLLTAPGVLELLDSIAGPLTASTEGKVVPAKWHLLSWERAAATLQADQRHWRIARDAGRQPTAGPDLEMLRAGAFLRSVRPDLPRPVDARRLAAEFTVYFPDGVSGFEMLVDIIDALRAGPNRSDLIFLVDTALGRVAPSPNTGELATRVVDGRSIDPRSTLGIHIQFSKPLPVSPRFARSSLAPNQPDKPESDLLTMLLNNGLAPELAGPALDRLARWVLLRPAQYLGFAAARGNDAVPPWLRQAGVPPLSRSLARRYERAAANLVRDIESTDNRPAAEDICIEWIIRSTLADRGIRSDPAWSFFAADDKRPGAWHAAARRLMQPEKMNRERLQKWAERARTVAMRTAQDSGLIHRDDDRDSEDFVNACARGAGRLVDIQGLRSLLKRNPPRK